jgi:colanic acid biosynthesis protein WcaH
MPAPLDAATFAHVVTHAPLVSLDLIVTDRAGRVLLGRRRNRPAQGSWFVPGGRVRKDERLDDAFLRLTEAELGVRVARAEAPLHGVYEHLYDDGFAGEHVSTHYVVVAHRLPPRDLDLAALPPDQHGDYRLAAVAELVADPTVHAYTRAYFTG